MRKFVFLVLLLCLVAPIGPSTTNAQYHGCWSFLTANTGTRSRYSPGTIDQYAEMACDEDDGPLCLTGADVVAYVTSPCLGGLMETNIWANYGWNHGLVGYAKTTYILPLFGVIINRADGEHDCAGLAYFNSFHQPCP